MTHYHDITLTEIDYICNTLFQKNDQSFGHPRHVSKSEYTYQQLRQCIMHKNFKKSTYDFNTGSCSGNIEHDKLLHTNQRKDGNKLVRISDEEWEQSCTYTSIHTMFAFLSMFTNTEETIDDPYSNMELCIVCEKEAKNAVFAMLNQLEIYTILPKAGWENTRPSAKITYIDQEELEKDSLYLHRFVSNYDNDELHLHLLVLSPIDKNMIPNINKENKSMSYTCLTGIVSADGEIIFPPVTIPPCFTGVIATIIINTTFCNTKDMLMKVSKYGCDGCVCGTNIEYEEDVIHSHYREDLQEEYNEDNTYYAPYFQIVGKPMPRSKFVNDAVEDCLGCRVVARIIIDKRQKPKRSHENLDVGVDDDVINKLSKIH